MLIPEVLVEIDQFIQSKIPGDIPVGFMVFICGPENYTRISSCNPMVEALPEEENDAVHIRLMQCLNTELQGFSAHFAQKYAPKEVDGELENEAPEGWKVT